MVLPRFSLRWIFLATTVFAFFSLVLAQAAQGRAWALAFSLTVFAVAGLLLLHAGVFALARLMRLITLREVETSAGGRSPFAAVQANLEGPFASQPPVKQVIVPPADPDL